MKSFQILFVIATATSTLALPYFRTRAPQFRNQIQNPFYRAETPIYYQNQPPNYYAAQLINPYLRAHPEYFNAALYQDAFIGDLLGLFGKVFPKVELNIPGYNFCGPNTDLARRLAEGQTGINPLDDFCRDHDIAYSQTTDQAQITAADRILVDKAWQRYLDPKTPLKEKIDAWLVVTVMKLKILLDGGK